MLGFGKKRIYLDHASATPLCEEASLELKKGEEYFANPGGIHADSVRAKTVLQESRGRIARELGCKTGELVFTSGLSESNNLAILGFARKLSLADSLKGTHWIVSEIEHDSVLECFAEVERLGGDVSHACPDAHGIITPEEIARLVRGETIFVSVGWANNEIGTIQPLRDISRVLREKGGKKKIFFHSDGGQGPLYISPQVHTLGVDFFSLGAGKLYGPRTAGCLYVREHTALAPILLGGSQEGGLRAGTEHVVPAVGFARALEVVGEERESEAKRLRVLRDSLAKKLSENIPDLVINGDLKHVLPHMLNVSVPNISAEYIVLALDKAGIAISTKSACREGESTSHVVATLHGEEWRARNTLRISMGRGTKEDDVKKVVIELTKAVQSFQQSSHT